MTNKRSNTLLHWLKGLVFVAILFGGVFIVTQEFFGQTHSEHHTPTQTDNGKINEPDAFVAHIPAFKKPIKIDNYAGCENLVKQYQDDSFSWAKKAYSKWDQYIQEGYSLDDVTLAVEYFLNSNFAAEFRVEQLRKNAELTLTNQEIDEQVKEVAPSIFETLPGIRFTKAIPVPALADFALLSTIEKTHLLENVIPSVDDVAYFIHQKDLSNDDILTLLAKTPDPSALVGYDRIEAVSLLDYAVNATRPAVVARLLELGVQPSTDQYLGSTMEWALSRLYAEDSNDAANIVLMLQEQGAQARFTDKSAKQVKGNFPRRFYQFDAAKINELAQKYALDLLQIATREGLAINKNKSVSREGSRQLVEILKQQPTQKLAEQLDIQDLPRQLEHCQTKIDEIKSAWTPRDASIILAEVIAKYPDSVRQVVSELAKIDPVLVDYYHINNPSKIRKQMNSKDFDQYFKGLNIDNLEVVIARLLELPLTDANKNYLFSQLLSYNPQFYGTLIHSALLVDEIPYFSFYDNRLMGPSTLATLITMGAPVFDTDSRGKTLLFYAAERGDVALLSFMAEEGFPFAENQAGEDPLHTALSLRHYRFKVEDLPEIVDILMTYQPVIDPFHLRRMAIIKLRYPVVYQQLSSQYPQLSVSDDTPFPAVR